VSEKELIRALRAIADRLHLTIAEVGVLAGVSAPTASQILRDGKLPRMARCVRGVELLVQRAAVARTRSELGLP
jgi:transcriptional regulator with XRE-family HTH domain